MRTRDVNNQAPVRFVKRQGHLILQQGWSYTEYNEEGKVLAGGIEWVDVPIEEEE